MTKSNRSTIDVDFLLVKFKGPQHSQGLGGKSFIQLEQVDIILLQASFFQHLRDSYNFV